MMAQSQSTRIELDALAIERIVLAIQAALSADYQNIVAKLDAAMALLVQIEQEINAPAPVAVRIRLGVATDFRKGIQVNEQLPNDVVRWRDIEVDDGAGNPVPAPSGDTFTVVSNNPASLNAVVGTGPTSGNQAIGYNALVQVSPGVSFTVSDNAGLQSFTETIDIVENVTPVKINLAATVTDVPQPIPTNPGP